MYFNIRKTGGGYFDVEVSENNTSINLGLLNEEEAETLAVQLLDAVEDLEYTPLRQRELEGVLEKVFEFAHDNSQGPAIQDDLWTIREMIREVL